jgi:hypothetical protein
MIFIKITIMLINIVDIILINNVDKYLNALSEENLMNLKLVVKVGSTIFILGDPHKGFGVRNVVKLGTDNIGMQLEIFLLIVVLQN